MNTRKRGEMYFANGFYRAKPSLETGSIEVRRQRRVLSASNSAETQKTDISCKYLKKMYLNVMKIELHYVSDTSGKTRSVQLPINDWEKVLQRLEKYEQALKLKSDLNLAMAQVDQIRKSKAKKTTLKDFLNEF
jgi:hypothetical protein